MLADVLFQRRAAICKRWFDRILESYPVQGAKFLRRREEAFRNPVGATIAREIQFLFDQLLQGIDKDKAASALENLIRIRAVQDFSPSQAVGFFFDLKAILREEVAADAREAALMEELSALEARIDELALMAFDVYMKCREKVFEIRAQEIKRAAGMWPQGQVRVRRRPDDGQHGSGPCDPCHRTGGIGP